MKAGWCIHYTGILGRAGESKRRCKAGVLYDDVLPETGHKLPCLGDSDTECVKREIVTVEQEQESYREALRRLEQVAEVIAAGKCPHCGRAMTSQKVGRCLYANPCGHRLNEIPSVIRGLG